jgi:thiopeptide-type bacteriocin biosynthesis protein
MDSRDGRPLYACADAALVRAAAHRELALPEWPDLTEATPAHARQWCGWLRDAWAVDAVAETIGHATPALAQQIAAICEGQLPGVRQARGAVLSMSRYLLRMTGRATPFGLFAGVASASFGPQLAVRWGDGHRAVARAGASWLAEVMARLESCPQLLERLPLVVNNLCFLRGQRLVVPFQPQTHGEDHIAAVEVSIRYTAAVRMVVEAARAPIRCGVLAGKVAAEFPTASSSAVDRLLTDLVERRVLISSLHAPSTVTDAFEYLLEQLETAGAGDIPQVRDLLCQLRQVMLGITRHNDAATTTAGRSIRTSLGEQMTALSPTARQPLAVDLRLDCDVALPQQVAREAEAAASALARLTAHPFGSVAWQSYHTRFFERYGIGALVPVLDVVNPDIGLGFPAGYPGSTAQERPTALLARDGRLLALAQAAALEGRDEVTLDERLVAELAADDLGRARVPPHVELCFEVQAASQAALGRGEFDLTIVNLSRGVGTVTGRFYRLLDPSDQDRAATVFARLPASDPDTLAVQLSFLPLAPGAAHVTRTPELLPTVISLAEHRAPSDTVIRLEDLAVASDGHRLYLASIALARRLEPAILHALDLRTHTPPLARFLAEVGRAQAAVVTGFDWGAASHLPFLPRVRYRRTILSPARWLLDPAELPSRDAPWTQWQDDMAAWSTRRRLPKLVYLTDRDRRLKLDLDQVHHLALLRAYLDSAGNAALTEAPHPGAFGWFGGRAHEIVVSLTAAKPLRWPRLPQVTSAPVVGRDHGHLPGTSRWLYAKLYGHPERQHEILAEYLPELLSAWDEPPLWWYIPYCDPEDHLRLRIALSNADEFGSRARRVSSWADRLRRLSLLRDVQFATYHPETGRWGDGDAMTAAEVVFGADSRALVVQFAQPSRPHTQALAAANFVAIAAGFTGSAEAGMNWLIQHAKTEPSPAPPRHVFTEAVRLADPRADWAALRAAPGGQAIAKMWEPRRQALADYRARLENAEGIDPDEVLVCLLHAHHIRAVGIDRDNERTCLRLARATALTWDAHTGRSRT